MSNQRPLLNSICTLCYSSPGWTLVFKVVSGVDKKVWDLYNSDQASAELVTAALDVTNQHQDHYKNRVVMNWQNFNPSQVYIKIDLGYVYTDTVSFVTASKAMRLRLSFTRHRSKPLL